MADDTDDDLAVAAAHCITTDVI